MQRFAPFPVCPRTVIIRVLLLFFTPDVVTVSGVHSRYNLVGLTSQHSVRGSRFRVSVPEASLAGRITVKKERLPFFIMRQPPIIYENNYRIVILLLRNQHQLLRRCQVISADPGLVLTVRLFARCFELSCTSPQKQTAILCSIPP
jgi:hypothetical protein